MFVLKGSVLNWLEYQFSKEIEMDRDTNSLVWLSTELAHGISMRFQYQIVFG